MKICRLNFLQECEYVLVFDRLQILQISLAYLMNYRLKIGNLIKFDNERWTVNVSRVFNYAIKNALFRCYFLRRAHSTEQTPITRMFPSGTH